MVSKSIQNDFSNYVLNTHKSTLAYYIFESYKQFVEMHGLPPSDRILFNPPVNGVSQLIFLKSSYTLKFTLCFDSFYFGSLQLNDKVLYEANTNKVTELITIFNYFHQLDNKPNYFA